MRNFIAALLVSLTVGLVGCGASPMPSTPDAAGPMADARPVDAGTADVQIAPDTGATDTGVGSDATPSDTDGLLCIPTRFGPNPGDIETCAGYACQPNSVNPTCEAATSCDCNMRAAQMPPTVCTPTAMPACMATVHCSPGRNHCSVNIPNGTDLTADTAFPFLAPNGNGRGGLRRLIREDWNGEDGLHGLDLETADINARGFVEVCFRLPTDATIPEGLVDTRVCAECVGRTCYWNRGRLSNGLPTVEIEFRADSAACALTMRLYAAGAERPGTEWPMIANSTLCN